MIRVEAAVPWPAKHTTFRVSYSNDNVRKGRPTATFRRILTLGPPCPSQPEWICGTDVVWPVLELDGVELEPLNGNRPYVCRHQIVAGD